MEVLVNWEEIRTEEDFYNVFLPQIEAPKWHGRNLDALNDSLVTGQINCIEPLYCIKNINTRKCSDDIVNLQRKVFSVFVDAAIEPKGVEVIIK